VKRPRASTYVRVDGSVGFWPARADKKMLMRVFQRSDGEAVEWP